MTSYNTCAYPGCYCKIPYEPGGEKPSKYCEAHEKQMRKRVTKAMNFEE